MIHNVLMCFLLEVITNLYNYYTHLLRASSDSNFGFGFYRITAAGFYWRPSFCAVFFADVNIL